MKRGTSYNRILFNLLILFAILLYSFFGNTDDILAEYGGDSLLEQFCYVSLTTTFSDLECPDDSLYSISQAVFERQLRYQRKITEFGNGGLYIETILPVFLLIFLSIMNLCCFVRNSSHRFVIRFIHNKDGQKA